MIEFAILGLLRDSDVHGYELKKRIAELVGTRAAASYGSLYPALAKLEASGLVRAVELDSSSAYPTMPMTGSLGGEAAAFLARRRAVRGVRGKKVLSITPSGIARFDELLADPSLDEREFHLKLAFCSHLSPETRLELFTRRRARQADRLHEQRRAHRASAHDRYLRALHSHDDDAIDHEVAWLDTLIADERASFENSTAIHIRVTEETIR